MSTIHYNGIDILDVLTEDIDQRVEYDSTGTDPIYIHTRASFRGTVHIFSPATHGYSGGANLALNYRTLEAALLQPRKRFHMTIGGNTLFDVRPGDAGGPMNQLDVNNGPRPGMKVLSIEGESALKIQFTIEFCRPNCPNSSSDGILNLRFWIADDIDCDNWHTVRTYHGRLRLAHSNLNPHSFRNLVVPTLMPGFTRKRVNVAGSPNGLELEFTITDQEQWAAAPGPASNWEGFHMTSSPMPGGTTFDHEVNLMLEAPKSVGKKELLKLAAKILDAKLHLNDQARDNKLFMLRTTWRDDLKHNRIEANAACRTFNDAYLINVGEKELGAPVTLPGYNKEFAEPHSTTATTAGLFLSAIQTPCNPAKMPQVVVKKPDADEETTPGTDPPVVVTETTLPSYEQKYSQSHQQNIYTGYRSTSEYDFDEGIVSLPVGKSSRSGTSSVAIALYQGQASRVLRVEAERLNAWPEIPSPATFTDVNGIVNRLVRSRPMPNAPVLSGDGRKTLHSVAYELTYQLSRKPRANEQLPVGKLPFRALVANESNVRNMPGTVFVAPGTSGSIV